MKNVKYDNSREELCDKVASATLLFQLPSLTTLRIGKKKLLTKLLFDYFHTIMIDHPYAE